MIKLDLPTFGGPVNTTRIPFRTRRKPTQEASDFLLHGRNCVNPTLTVFLGEFILGKIQTCFYIGEHAQHVMANSAQTPGEGPLKLIPGCSGAGCHPCVDEIGDGLRLDTPHTAAGTCAASPNAPIRSTSDDVVLAESPAQLAGWLRRSMP